MVRVCVDDPVLDANGEFTGYYHLAGPNCPEVSIRTYSYLNLERESVGGAVAEDSQYFYSAYVRGRHRAVHRPRRGRPDHRPRRPQWGGGPQRRPRRFRDEPGTGDPGGDSSGSSSQPGTDDPGTPGSSSSGTTDPMGNAARAGWPSIRRPAGPMAIEQMESKGGETSGSLRPLFSLGELGKYDKMRPLWLRKIYGPFAVFRCIPPGGVLK